jgi:hypothetical protein
MEITLLQLSLKGAVLLSRKKAGAAEPVSGTKLARLHMA